MAASSSSGAARSAEESAATTASSTSTVSLEVKDCPIAHVSVFNDRAEVTRRVTFTPTAVGEIDVVCSGLTTCADPDTLRMTGIRGRCTIVEVSSDLQRRRCEPDLGKIEALRVEVSQLDGQISRKQAARRRLLDTRGLVEKYLQTVVTAGKPSGGDATPLPGLEDVGRALTFFEERTAQVDERLAACDEELATLEESLVAARAGCVKAGQSPKGGKMQESRDVTVKLEITVLEEIELQMVYMATKASWSPSYDIRVTASDGAEPTMALIYFGLVKQATGEDWSGCNLSLSTAVPSRGGMPAQPPLKLVRWRTAYRHTSYQTPPVCLGRRQVLAPQMEMALAAPQAAFTNSMMEVRAAEAEEAVPLPMDALEAMPQVAQAGVADAGVGHATFVIERRVNIESDNKPHKVTIAFINLSPKFVYFATPELEETAYLQCRAVNTSDYKLLASPKVSVFFNGGFVTTTAIKDTSANEELMTFLGTDSAVKIEHRRISAKHSENKGFMSSNKQTTTYEYLTTVTNTKKTPATVKVVGVLPRSQEESITIELLQPGPGEIVREQDARTEDVVMQNPITNNIVWLKTLAAGQKLELRLQYAMSWPRNKEIEVEQREGTH